MRSSLRPLALAACLALGATAAAQAPPAPPAPPAIGSRVTGFAINDLTQIGARSAEDLAGRTLLIEFFAFWCHPCGLQVPHLNELQERYGERGLTIVALTSEAKDKTEKWIAEKGARYGYGYDEGRKLMDSLGLGFYPSAVLLDPSGTLVWKGNPAALGPELLEQALVGALPLPLWEWPEEAAAVKEAYVQRQLSQALRRARGLGDTGKPLALILEELIRGRGEALRRAHGAGDYLETLALAEACEQELAGLPEAEEAARLRAAIARDAEAQRILEGQRSLAKLAAEAGGMRRKKDAEALIPAVQKLVLQYPGTIVETRGRELVARLQEAVRRAG